MAEDLGNNALFGGAAVFLGVSGLLLLAAKCVLRFFFWCVCGLGVVWVYGWMRVCACVVVSISCGVFRVRLALLGGWLYALCCGWSVCGVVHSWWFASRGRFGRVWLVCDVIDSFHPLVLDMFSSLHSLNTKTTNAGTRCCT